jgi:phospholipase/carboxylesterase
MNRIELPTQSFISTSHSSNISFSGSNNSHDGTTLAASRIAHDWRAPHATFVPIHYEQGYAYPLVVWLHGSLGNELEVRQVMSLVSMRNYVAIAPRGPSADRRTAHAYHWRQTDDDIEESEARIAECIDFAQRRYNIHADRIFLVGSGSGGTMAVRAAWNNPGKYAGVATIDGSLPTRHCPLRHVKQLRSLPCLLAMSRGSQCYPDDHVCSDLRLLHSAGCTVALRQYPDGDELTTVMFSDLNRWLMEIVCGNRLAG